MERKLNKILAYLKPKNTPVLDIPTEEATDSKLVTVSYFTFFTTLNRTLILYLVPLKYLMHMVLIQCKEISSDFVFCRIM